MQKIKNNITVKSRAGLKALDSLKNLGYDFNNEGKITSAADESYDKIQAAKERRKYLGKYADEYEVAERTRNAILEILDNDKLYQAAQKIEGAINEFRHDGAAMLTSNPATFIPGAVWSALNLAQDYAHGDVEGMKRDIKQPVEWFLFGKGLGLAGKGIKTVYNTAKKIRKLANPVATAVNEVILGK